MTEASIESDLPGEELALESTLTKIEKIKEAIWERRPILGEIMRRHGQRTLTDYARDFFDVNPSARLDERKPELISMVERLLTERLGATVASEVATQLKFKPLVSTIDHHGPVDHPFFVNTNIVSSLPLATGEHPAVKYNVVFSFSSVSVNNASAFPRGILFHGGMSPQEKMLRLPILPDRSKMGVVYGVSGMTSEDIAKAHRQLIDRVRAGDVSAERAEGIRNILEKHFATDDVLNTADLTAQITKINYGLWPSLFRPASATRVAAPQLIYLDIESLVTSLLTERHLLDSSSLVNRLLFDSAVQALVEKYFDNIPGGFSLDRRTGTYFFWALDDKRRRVGLRREGEWLVSADGTIRVARTSESIIQALSTKQIFPSMLLCYLVVALYYGMKCLGGFCQVHDLTLTKRAWQNLLRDMGEEEEALAINPVQTKELGGDGMVLAYQEQSDGSLVAASGIDLVLDSQRAAHSDYMEVATTVSLNDVMSAMLPEMYTVLYSADERAAQLANLDPAEILRHLGVETKLRHSLRQIHNPVRLHSSTIIKAGIELPA